MDLRLAAAGARGVQAAAHRTEGSLKTTAEQE